jgi:hypothetical protein
VRRLVSLIGAVAIATLFAAPTVTASTTAGGPRAHAAMVRYLRTHGYLVGDQARYDRLKAQASAWAARSHPQSAAPVSPHNPVASPSWQGAEEDDLAPPDPTGAIGPKSYIEFINNQLAIYNRSGGLIASAPTESMFGGDHFDYSDPQAIWDPHTSRFYILVLNVNNDTFSWGFSKSANPTSIPGSFCTYVADFGYGSSLPDYPKLGQTTDFLLIGANIYLNLATFVGSDIDWITKPQGRKPITTCPAATSFKQGTQSQIKNDDGVTLASTPEPGVQVDPSSKGWVVAGPDSTLSGASGTKLEI